MTLFIAFRASAMISLWDVQRMHVEEHSTRIDRRIAHTVIVERAHHNRIAEARFDALRRLEPVAQLELNTADENAEYEMCVDIPLERLQRAGPEIQQTPAAEGPKQFVSALSFAVSDGDMKLPLH
jgi:phage baseplate assembly protein W